MVQRDKVERGILTIALLIGLLVWPTPSFAAEQTFGLDGVSLSLQERADVGVLFSSMRFNRAAQVWNVEVAVTNSASTPIKTPVVVSIQSFSGTTGVQN